MPVLLQQEQTHMKRIGTHLRKSAELLQVDKSKTPILPTQIKVADG
ncbi:MAG: hypothetical protein AAFY91_07720 [Bacteroidota bacterium]